jgi:RHS repeat-associated protein
VRDAVGNTTALERDALGRPTTIQYAPDHLAAFRYDQGQVGHLSKIDDKAGTTSYVRDAQGRILSKTQSVNDNPANPSQFKVQYGYTNGELTSLTYSSGLKVFYRRSAGRTTGIDVQAPSVNPLKPKPVAPFVTNLAYTALGQPKAWTWSSGDAANRIFDTDGRMTATEFSTYSWDAASRITGIGQNLWASRTVGKGKDATTELYTTPLAWSAGYDNRNRLTSLVRAGAETRYTYDANSNRLSAIDKVTSDTDLDGVFDVDDFSQTTSQSPSIDAASNKLLGFTQTVTKVKGTKTQSITSSQVGYSLDANGAMTSDGLRTFEYDASGRLSKVKILKDGEAAKLSYLHNALGQRVFKSEVTAEQTLPNESTLGLGFIDWLKKNFQWMFIQAQANTSIGTGFVYDEDGNLLGEYDNGSAAGKGRQEYIWLPTDDGQAVPIGIYKGERFYAVHADHLGTPRLITNDSNKPVWQWPYSAFGNNKPSGILKATPSPKAAITNQPELLKATNAGVEVNLRFPGQYFDEESNLSYNYFRSYSASQGRYSQPDPIGLAGGSNRFHYAGGNPLSHADPLGLATFTLTGGGSAVFFGGGEGSVGIYFSNKPNDIGIVISGGAGVGANVGPSAQVGYVPGLLSNVSGKTKNYNASCVIGSGTWMTDPKTGAFAGVSIGPAGRLGLSATNAETGTWGLRDAADWLLNKLGGLQ